MAKCKLHIYEIDGGGVCASCLRERLLSILAADPDALPTAVKRRSRSVAAPPPQPPLPAFPRSVSPYVSRRRSLDADASARMSLHLQRFNNTPQDRRPAAAGDLDLGADRRRKRFFPFPYLPRNHRSEHEKTDSASNGGKRGPGANSWLFALIGGDRCRKPAPATAPPAERARCRSIERGMSPVRYSNGSDDSVCSSESGGSPPWRQPLPTPMRGDAGPPACRRQRRGAGRASGVSAGFAMCLSPLMRANPNYRQAADAGGGGGGSSESRHHRHGSAGAAPWLAPNRSRKLAFGPTS